MHAGKLATSPKLQRLLQFLRECGPRGATSLEIAGACHVVAPGTDVSALRHNGCVIDCIMERKTSEGGRVYRYFLKENGKQLELL